MIKSIALAAALAAATVSGAFAYENIGEIETPRFGAQSDSRAGYDAFAAEPRQMQPAMFEMRKDPKGDVSNY